MSVPPPPPEVATSSLWVCAAATVLLFSSCLRGSGGSGGSGGGGSPAPASEATAMIGPAGGVLAVTAASSPLFGVRLEVPAGALAAATELALGGLSFGGAPPSPSQPLIGVSIVPSGTTFAIPARLDLPYADSGARSIGEELLVRAFGTGPAGWEELPALDRDPAANRVRVSVDHLSAFVLTPAYQLLGPTIRAHVDMTAEQHQARRGGVALLGELDQRAQHGGEIALGDRARDRRAVGAAHAADGGPVAGHEAAPLVAVGGARVEVARQSSANRNDRQALRCARTCELEIEAFDGSKCEVLINFARADAPFLAVRVTHGK